MSFIYSWVHRITFILKPPFARQCALYTNLIMLQAATRIFVAGCQFRTSLFILGMDYWRFPNQALEKNLVVVQRRGQIRLYFSLVSCLSRTNTLSISLLHLQCTPTFCNHFHHSRQIRLHFESCFSCCCSSSVIFFFVYQGLDSGFGGEDDGYNVYDKAWRREGSTANAIYRPGKNVDRDVYGDDLEKLVSTSR